MLVAGFVLGLVIGGILRNQKIMLSLMGGSSIGVFITILLGIDEALLFYSVVSVFIIIFAFLHCKFKTFTPTLSVVFLGCCLIARAISLFIDGYPDLFAKNPVPEKDVAHMWMYAGGVVLLTVVSTLF